MQAYLIFFVKILQIWIICSTFAGDLCSAPFCAAEKENKVYFRYEKEND